MSNEIYNELSEEEKKVLDSIEKKIQKQLLKIKESKYDEWESDDPNKPPDFSVNHPEIIHPTHITNAPKEITIKVNAEVSEIDNKGYLTNIVDLFEQFYHIPVPPGVDHSKYVDLFFQKFHKDLSETCSEVDNDHKEPESKE